MKNWMLGSAQRTLLALAALLVMAGPASALVNIEFDDVLTNGGSLDFAGNFGDPLIGTDIIFDQVFGPAPTLFCGDCLLNFVTGGLTDVFLGSIYAFAPGGTYVVTGTLFDNPLLLGAPVAFGILVSGSFDLVTATLNTDLNLVNISGSGTDIKNEDLVAYFGLTGLDFIYSQTEVSGDDTIIFPPGLEGVSAFTASTINADLNNFPANRQIVPEPGTLLLLGTGLAGLGAWRRRSGAPRP